MEHGAQPYLFVYIPPLFLRHIGVNPIRPPAPLKRSPIVVGGLSFCPYHAGLRETSPIRTHGFGAGGYPPPGKRNMAPPEFRGRFLGAGKIRPVFTGPPRVPPPMKSRKSAGRGLTDPARRYTGRMMGPLNREGAARNPGQRGEEFRRAREAARYPRPGSRPRCPPPSEWQSQARSISRSASLFEWSGRSCRRASAAGKTA